MAIQVPAGTMSYEEFLRAYDGVHAEWVHGEVVPMTPISPRHQQIAIFLSALFQHFCEERRAGVVLSAPVQMKVGEVAREPDVMVLTPEHAERIKSACVEGPADLVVEVICPESRGRDRGDKFYEYEQAGVREYWLIDPQRRRAEFHRLGERQVYEPVALDEAGRFESRVLPGLWIRVEWLWHEPLPPLLGVLKEWGLV
ncbi:MAG TPA: Uma2 family endonuclease [Longimicrobiaceae bacterium]|nr:Uma2 family endonuclease [Longimicrobiaceae bacterium]